MVAAVPLGSIPAECGRGAATVAARSTRGFFAVVLTCCALWCGVLVVPVAALGPGINISGAPSAPEDMDKDLWWLLRVAHQPQCLTTHAAQTLRAHLHVHVHQERSRCMSRVDYITMRRMGTKVLQRRALRHLHSVAVPGAGATSVLSRRQCVDKVLHEVGRWRRGRVHPRWHRAASSLKGLRATKERCSTVSCSVLVPQRLCGHGAGRDRHQPRSSVGSLLRRCSPSGR